MGFHLLTILRGQSNIRKVVVLSQVSKSVFDVLLEVVPLEAELFRHVESHEVSKLYLKGTTDNNYNKLIPTCLQAVNVKFQFILGQGEAMIDNKIDTSCMRADEMLNFVQCVFHEF